MKVLDILNQVLIKRREAPLVANGLGTTYVSNGLVRLYNVFLEETCREVAIAGRIQGSSVTQSISVPGIAPTTQGGIELPNPGGIGDCWLRLDGASILQEGVTLKVISGERMKDIRLPYKSVEPTTGTPEFISVALNSASLGTTDVALPLEVFPRITAGKFLRIIATPNWYRWLQGSAVLNDTAGIPLPGHLLVLGVYEKALREAYGPDDAKAQDARSAFLGALSTEIAMDGQLEGSELEQWYPQ